MIKNLQKRIKATEQKIYNYVECISDGMMVIEDSIDEIHRSMNNITRLLEEVQAERDYVDNNLDNLLREQRNLTNLESALMSLELIEGEEVEEVEENLENSDEDEEEDLDSDEEDEEDDFDDEEDDDDFDEDICDDCGLEDLTVITEDGSFLCKDCYKKRVIAEYEKELADKEKVEKVEEIEKVDAIEEIEKTEGFPTKN